MACAKTCTALSSRLTRTPSHWQTTLARHRQTVAKQSQRSLHLQTLQNPIFASVGVLQINHRHHGDLADARARLFSTSRRQLRDHHFDTLKFVERLKSEGLSEEQAKAMTCILSDVIEESIQNLTRTMVLKEDANRSTYTQKVDFTKLRSELLAQDANEESITQAAHERLSNDLAKLNSKLHDEISRAQASMRLDLNLEKGRIREEAKGQEMKIKETETRIEQEVAGLKERVEGVKFSTLQWLMGVCTGTAALILGVWRLLM